MSEPSFQEFRDVLANRNTNDDNSNDDYSGEQITLKISLLEYLNSPAPADSLVDGQPFNGTTKEYYLALYDIWYSIKSKWDEDVQAKKNSLPTESFLEWFETHAEGRLANIDAAMGKLVAIFSPSDMKSILEMRTSPNHHSSNRN